MTASNGVGADAVQNFSLVVQLAPSITSPSTTTFTVGTVGTFNVATTGAPAPGLTIVGTLPTGISLVDNGNGTGTLSGTAAAGTGGSHAFTIQASNGAGSPATQAFTLLVEEAPLLTSPDAATFVVGTLGTFTVTTSGSPAPTITRGRRPDIAGRHDLHRQPGRHRDVDGHAARRDGRHLSADVPGNQQRGRLAAPELHLDR